MWDAVYNKMEAFILITVGFLNFRMSQFSYHIDNAQNSLFSYTEDTILNNWMKCV